MELNNKFLLKYKKFFIAILIITASLVLIGIGYSIKIIDFGIHLSILEWFSVLASISQFLLVVLGLFVFVQIRIAKDAFKIQCERDALNKSVNLAHLFANQIIPKMDDYYKDLKKKNFTSTSMQLNDFCMDDIDLLAQDKKGQSSKDFHFFANNQDSREKCIYIFNDLEALAINFTKLVADEKSLFSALSQAYCSFVEKNYAVICLLRKTKHDLYYVNMLDLYKEWSKKIKLAGLLVESKGLNERVAEISKTCNNKYTPKGT